MHKAKISVSNELKQKPPGRSRKQHSSLILKVIVLAVAISTWIHFLIWPNILPIQENSFDYDSIQEEFESDNQDVTRDNMKYSDCSEEHQDVKNLLYSSESDRKANCIKATKQNHTVNSSTPIHSKLKNDVKLTTKCENSPLRMVSDSDEFRPNCKWVKRNPKLRCTRPGVSEHCPETCKTCVTCKDSLNGFYEQNGERRTCEYVAEKKNERCKHPEYRNSCRLTCGVCDANQRKPNIIIILADDIGTGDIPFFWNTNTSKVDMPNIQALASKGVMFTDVHSTPLCAPSRYMILSGNYAHRGRRKGGMWGIGGNNQFRSHEVSMAKPFQNEGYHTAMFGKWHLGGKVPPNGRKSHLILSSDQHNWTEPLIEGPQEIGFDRSRITFQGIQGGPYSFFRNGYLETVKKDVIMWEPGEYPMPQGTSIIQKGWRGEGDISWDSSAYNMILVNETKAFLDDHLNSRKDDPFFVHVALGTAHIPHSPPNFFLDGTPVNGTYATRHLDMLHELDKVVGSLVTEIEDRNMADNTIIVFTSDNGGIGTKHGSHAYGHSPSGPLKGAKGKVWEGGHRVPMIVRYDNHFPVNERRNRLLGLHDIYATLIELAGLSVPYGSAYDSISFADYLYSEEATENLRESLGTWKQSESAAVRVGEMKYIEFYGKPKPPELHNLTSDIRERTNLLESDNAEYVVLSNDMKQILDGLSREGPDVSNKFRISTGFGFQDEILSDCEFFKSDPKRCNVYWEGLFNCRSSCHPDHH